MFVCACVCFCSCGSRVFADGCAKRDKVCARPGLAWRCATPSLFWVFSGFSSGVRVYVDLMRDPRVSCVVQYLKTEETRRSIFGSIMSTKSGISSATPTPPISSGSVEDKVHLYRNSNMCTVRSCRKPFGSLKPPSVPPALPLYVITRWRQNTSLLKILAVPRSRARIHEYLLAHSHACTRADYTSKAPGSGGRIENPEGKVPG